MQQTPTQEPLQEQVSAEAQETVTAAPTGGNPDLCPGKEGQAGKNIKRIILWGLLAAPWFSPSAS